MFSASATAFPTMSNPPSTTSTNASGFTELWSMVAAREKQAEEAAILVSDESTSSVSSDSPYSSDAAVDADTGDTSIAALTSTFDKSLRVVDDQQTQKLAPPLPSYYLAVDLESNCTSTTQSNAHEQALLSEYERREGTNLRSLEEAVAGGDDDMNKWSGEAYEQSHPKYISKTFRRFQKTLALQPEQVLRYVIQDGVNILVIFYPFSRYVDTTLMACRCGTVRTSSSRN